MQMRRPLPVLLLVAAAVLARWIPPATARPEFARREGKACGFCHINPRGGGPRNETGRTYAKNEFHFPPRKGDLNSFSRTRDRDAMVLADRLIDIQHVPAAFRELTKLERAVRDEPEAHRLVASKLHELEVKGTEMLGRARILLRDNEREEGIELLVLIDRMFKGLEVHADARSDLKEARRNAELKDLVRKEEHEAKAHLALLDARRVRLDGDAKKTERAYRKVVDHYPGSRAAEEAAKELPPPVSAAPD